MQTKLNNKIYERQVVGKAFTFVELIIVITIVSILSIVAVISYKSYVSHSRDGVRKSELSDIYSFMKAYKIKEALLLPDKKIDIYSSGTLIGYQGLISDEILKIVGYKGKGKDPKDGKYYTYSLNKERRYFSLLGLLENKNLEYSSSQKFGKRYPIVFGEKLGIILDKNGDPINLNKNTLSNGKVELIDLDNSGEEYKVCLSNGETITNSGITLEVLYGTTLTGIIGNSCEDYKRERNGDSLRDGKYLLKLENGEFYEKDCVMNTLKETRVLVCAGTPNSSFGEIEITNNKFVQTLSGGIWKPNIKTWGYGQEGCGFTCKTGYAWNGSKCYKNPCEFGFHQIGGVCVADREVCSVENGEGERTWEGNIWGKCKLKICYNGYHEELEICLPDKKVIDCDAIGLNPPNSSYIPSNQELIWYDGKRSSCIWVCTKVDNYKNLEECIEVGNGYYSPANNNEREECDNLPDTTESRNYYYTSSGNGVSNGCNFEYSDKCGVDEYESTDGECIEVGNGHYSLANNNEREECNNKPSHSYYTSSGNGVSNGCSWNCDSGWKRSGNVCYSYRRFRGSRGGCSKPCGGGIQYRSTYCRRNDGVVVSDSYCGGKLTQSRSCNTQECCTSGVFTITSGKTCSNLCSSKGSTCTKAYHRNRGDLGMTWNGYMGCNINRLNTCGRSLRTSPRCSGNGLEYCVSVNITCYCRCP